MPPGARSDSAPDSLLTESRRNDRDARSHGVSVEVLSLRLRRSDPRLFSGPRTSPRLRPAVEASFSGPWPIARTSGCSQFVRGVAVEVNDVVRGAPETPAALERSRKGRCPQLPQGDQQPGGPGSEVQLLPPTRLSFGVVRRFSKGRSG